MEAKVTRTPILVLTVALTLLALLALALPAPGQNVTKSLGANVSTNVMVGTTNVWIARNGKGKAFYLGGFNAGTTATNWIMVFDTNATPATGAVPLDVIPCPAGNGFYWAPEGGYNFRRGLVVASSLTPVSFTNATSDKFIATLNFYDDNF
jgi:hypothetical protein